MITPCNATEDLLKRYIPPGGLHDAKSVIMGINISNKRGRNKCLSDTEMALITNDETMQLALMTRIFIFQKILNFIELAMFIVPVDSQIMRIKDNYTNMKDLSQINLDKLLGTTSEACPGIKVPQSQQQDSFKQRPQPSTSAKDVVCNKCQHTGHYAKNCTSTFSKTGKFLGTGLPPPNHHWTKKNAAEAKAKKAAMVNTPPQQQR